MLNLYQENFIVEYMYANFVNVNCKIPWNRRLSLSRTYKHSEWALCSVNDKLGRNIANSFDNEKLTKKLLQISRLNSFTITVIR